ncbi:MAG: hypothetical protein ABJ004_00255 [Cyclobacteriaceae bacterium]
MRFNWKKLLNWLLGISGTLFLTNYLLSAGITVDGERVRTASTIFFVLTLISSIIYFSKKSTAALRTTLIVSTLFLMLNALLTFEVAYFEWWSYQLSKIHEMRTCELAEQAFNKDLKNGNLKYFTFGMGSDEPSENYLQDEYELSVWHMGCIVDQPLVCYNELVENHVSNERQIEFWAFMAELEKNR